MSKFNTYYFGEDISHCGSCWERDDETTYTLLTSLTLEEVKDKFEEYCWSLTKGWDGYSNFLEWMVDNSEDFEDELVYPAIYFEIKGSSYAPDMRGSSTTCDEYDVESSLKLENLKDWKELNKMWEEGRIKEEERARKRKEASEKDEKRKAKNAEAQRKYRAKKKEFEDYQKLKEKWEGKKLPKEPKEIPKPKIELDPKTLTDFGKFLEKYKEGKDGK